MPILRDTSGKLSGFAGLVLFILAAGMIWWVLDRAERRATWLQVEAQHAAHVDQPFPVLVHLAPMAEPGFLCADLHWGTSRNTPLQYLASGGSRAVGKEGGIFEFTIPVSPREGMRFIMGVIYFSPTGGWRDHKLAANTELIPVVSQRVAGEAARLTLVRLQPSSDLSEGHPPPVAGPRLLTGLVFLVALAAGYRGTQLSIPSRGTLGPGTGWWRLLLVLLGLACLWEVCGLEALLGEQARRVARAEDLYYPRAVIQKVAISAALASTMLLLVLVRRAHPSRRLLLVSFTVYAAIALVNLVSLHAVDRVAGLAWHGLTFLQGLKLVCAALVLYGVWTSAANPRLPEQPEVS
jgi:hypothetical protein